MTAAHRWTRERAAWVIGRAGRNAGARRRGELLMSRARKLERTGVGAGDSGFAEAATRNLFARNVMREDGIANQFGWFMLTSIWMGFGLMLVGPALLLAKAIYALWWWLIPVIDRMPEPWERKGDLGETGFKLYRVSYKAVQSFVRMRSWPLLVAAVLLVAASAFVVLVGKPPVIEVYLLVQLCLGLLRCAWLVRAYGWPAVAVKAKAAGTAIKPVRVGPTAAAKATAEAATEPEPVSPIAPIAVAGPVDAAIDNIVEVDEFNFDDEDYDYDVVDERPLVVARIAQPDADID